jgi:D-alanyl-D-alanine carboxypeptidase/D-alanyl-D-alanine-endopeptidase (penicillin-binding protein 4)
MPRLLGLFCALVLTASPLLAAKPKLLPERIATVLGAPQVSHGFWGIEIISIKTGKTLFAQNADKLFLPASNTKLFTTAAGFALLGPDFRFHTTVETATSPDKYGRLSGDLILVGRGDPNLSGRVLPYVYTPSTEPPANSTRILEELADAVVQKGVKVIDGDIVGDDTYFAFERYSEGWGQDDLMWADGAPASALTINDNVVSCHIWPGEHAGDRAFLSFEPFTDYYRIDNRLLTAPAATGPRHLVMNREPGGETLSIWGSIPLDDPGVTEALAIDDPALFAARLFRDLLRKRGVLIYGSARAHHTEVSSLTTFTAHAVASTGAGTSSAGSATLAAHDSLPLFEDLRVINKVSQNLHAELLLRMIGHEKGSGGSLQSGQEAVRRFVTEAGVPEDQFALLDGSGMSRQNLVSPHAVARLLQYVASQPWGSRFRETLSVAGVDGSLADRFQDSPAKGRVQAKTGSLSHVRALSGFATTDSGDEVAFSILTDSQNAPGKVISETIDRLVEAILADVPDSKKKRRP